MNRFWNWVKNEDTGERTLYLCGVIASESWYDDDITPAAFKAELLSGEGDITVWIDSPGGDCLAASQIYNMLMDYRGNVTVKIDSLAASAASVIAMAGTKVLISPVGLVMIHNPASIAIGNTDEMRKAIQMLDEVKDSILNAYEIKTGLSRARLSHLMDGETWLSAQKAIELGFADGMLFDTRFKNDDHNEAPIAVENSYTYSCRAVSDNLLNKLLTKIHSNTTAQPVGSIPVVQPISLQMPEPSSIDEEPNPVPCTVPPDPIPPPAPTEPEETVPTPASAESHADVSHQQPNAGVSISELERRLDLLKPYGYMPVTASPNNQH